MNLYPHVLGRFREIILRKSALFCFSGVLYTCDLERRLPTVCPSIQRYIKDIDNHSRGSKLLKYFVFPDSTSS